MVAKSFTVAWRAASERIKARPRHDGKRHRVHLINNNAWKWLASGKPLKPAARVLARQDHPLFLLNISFWEICKAVEHGTLIFTVPPLEWIRQALTTNITVL